MSGISEEKPCVQGFGDRSLHPAGGGRGEESGSFIVGTYPSVPPISQRAAEASPYPGRAAVCRRSPGN